MGIEGLATAARELGCVFKRRDVLAPRLSLGIGGEVSFSVQPSSWRAAHRFMGILKEEGFPFRVLGGGTNLLAAQGALPFGVLLVKGVGGKSRWEGNMVEADADVPLPALALESVRRGMAGLQGMGGIPGTVGGAVIMNAGSFGCEMAGLIEEVLLAEADGELGWRPAGEFTFGYRSSDLLGRGMVAGCRLRFKETDPELLADEFRRVKTRRRETQPVGAATAGSVFKNPEGDHAGRILESLGFKGRRRGDAGFSSLHANFLVNHGRATFDDAYGLCEEARSAAAAAGFALDYEMEVWR